MKRISSWIKSCLAKMFVRQQQPSTIAWPQPNADFYTNYFSLIAQGARLKLIEALFHLNAFALFETQPIILESELIEALKLKPIRAQKWLHLLSSEHFLVKTVINNQVAYQLSDGFLQFMHSSNWWGMQFFFNSWLVAADEDLTEVLRFGAVKQPVSWPPETKSQALWLENWMAKTVGQSIDCLLTGINFKKSRAVLDIGGGDGTVACALASAHPHLKVAVYNLPKSAQMARRKIAAQQLNQRVSVYEGDFISVKNLPAGFDLILFVRVLFDWNSEVSKKLLHMAYQALAPHGRVVICEFYKELNNNKCLASEYRYIFHDDFSAHVMKAEAEYRCLLEEVGFNVLTQPQKEQRLSHCSLLVAQK